jgi:hypothetical protein
MAKNLRGTDAAVKSARLALLRWIEADYLSDTAATQRVPPRQWRDMVFVFAGDLSPDARSAWIVKLRSAFVSSPDVVSPALAGDVVALVEALRRLGDADTAGLPRVFDEAWDARNKQEALSGADCEAIRASWLTLDERSLARKWAAREYDALLGTAEARSAIDLRGLAGLARALSVTGMTGKEKAHPEFAATVLRLARDGTLGPADSLLLRDLRGPLEADETRKLLEAGLADLKGDAHPALLAALAWSYRYTREGGKWNALMNKWVSGPDLKPNDKTRRLVEVAKVEGVVAGSKTPDLTWMGRALAAAESPAARADVLRQIMQAYVSNARYDDALKVLDKAEGRFKDKDTLAAVASLRKEVLSGQEQFAAQRRAARAAETQWFAQARQRELERRLAEAKRRKDAQAISRLERLLSEQTRAGQ